MASRHISQIYDPSQDQRKFATDKPQARRVRGHMFVKYTIVAMVHMVCTMGMSH